LADSALSNRWDNPVSIGLVVGFACSFRRSITLAVSWHWSTL